MTAIFSGLAVANAPAAPGPPAESCRGRARTAAVVYAAVAAAAAAAPAVAGPAVAGPAAAAAAAAAAAHASVAVATEPLVSEPLVSEAVAFFAVEDAEFGFAAEWAFAAAADAADAAAAQQSNLEHSGASAVGRPMSGAVPLKAGGGLSLGTASPGRVANKRRPSPRPAFYKLESTKSLTRD